MSDNASLVGRTQVLTVILYFTLYSATTNINKYVLSVLSFTYPTLFQGWQTLVGAILLRLMSETGVIEMDVWPTGIDRWGALHLLPSLSLYVCSIYSGSVALSKLPVPLFLSLQNATCLVTETADFFVHKKVPCRWKCTIYVGLLVSVLCTGYLHFKDYRSVYVWLIVHIVTLSTYEICQKVLTPPVPISEVQRMFLNYVFSVAVFIPCTYLLGDVTRAKDFQFWFQYKFYMGCALSGVLGCLLNLSIIHLADRSDEHGGMDTLLATAKIVASIVAMMFFVMDSTATSTFWTFVNFMCCIMLAEFNKPPRPKETTLKPLVSRSKSFEV